MKEIKEYSIESLISTTSEPKEFDFFRFEFFSKGIEHLKLPHRHDFYTFILLTSGRGSHDIDFTTYEIRPDRLFLIAPGQVHAWNTLIDVKGFMILFTDSFVALSKGRRIMASWSLFKPQQSSFFDLTTKEREEWIAECNVIENELLHQDNFSRDAIFYSVGKLLVNTSRLQARYKQGNLRGEEFLFTFQELIENNFQYMKSPNAYAKLLNMSPNYLNYLCKSKSGKTAGELIRQRILLEAKRLLAHTSWTVSEIAYHLNFEDNSYFGKFFKKYTGLTPESFRKQQH